MMTDNGTPHEGEMRAQEGIERAYAHAQEEWLAWAQAAVLACADTLAYFTSDDVQRLIPEGVTTREPRALGGVMRRAKARGLIYPTADFALSDRPVCHRNPKRVWGSWRNRLTYIARAGDPVG